MLDSTRRDLFLSAGVLAAMPRTTSREPVSGGARPSPISVRDFGAIGDGTYRPLRDRYHTLAAARIDFPFVSSLDQSIDYAAVQAALDAAQVASATVYLPAGRYIFTDTVLIPSYVGIEGESWWGTVIDNQNLRLDRPQFANKDPSSFVHVTMRNLTGHGGTHFLKVDARDSCSYNRFDGLNTNLQSVSDLAFNRLEVSRFNDCTFLSSGSGHRIDVQDFPCNANMLTNVRMTASGQGAIRLRGGELWLMLGGSIESGGSAGRADITLGAVPHLRGAKFVGVYFESGNEYALRAESGATGIVFEGCHFTGATAPQGFAPPRFNAGRSIVEFAGNDFTALGDKRVRGPEQMLLRGHNDGLLTADSVVWESLSVDSGVVRASQRRFATALPAFDLLRFGPGADASDAGPVLRGALRLTVAGRTGGVAVHETTLDVVAAPDRDGVIRLSHAVFAAAGPVQFRLASAVGELGTVLRLAAAGAGDWVLASRFAYDVLGGGGDIAVSTA